MKTLYNILLFSSSAIGIYVSIVLFFFSKHNRLLNRLLAVFTLMFTITYGLVIISKISWGIDVVALIRTFTPFYYIAYPPCYLYIRTFLQDDVKLTRKDLVHAIPFLLNLAYVTPLLYALITGQVQWMELTGQLNDPTHFINYGPIPDVYHVIFRSIIGILYTALSLRLLLGKKFQVFEALNKDTFPLAIKWIKYFIVVMVCHSVFSLLTKTQVYFFNKPGIVYDGNWMSIGLLLTFNFLFVYASFNPVILFGMPHFTRFLHPVGGLSDKSSHPQSFGISPAYRPMSGSSIIPAHTGLREEQMNDPVSSTIHLDLQEEEVVHESDATEDIDEAEAMLQLIERMDAYMAEKQPFRQKEFNTFTIGRDLQVPQHHIAYLFKYILKKSFVDYRNEYRVNYVIDLIKKGRHNHFTLETIGQDAGFNSKSTFFFDFKKITGKTPMQFLKEMNSGG
jgi:AraC-like DNA-binding protein